MPAFVTTEYVDDIDGAVLDEKSVDSVKFSYRGAEYTLVLTKEHGAKFDKDIAPYIKAAKKAQAQLAKAARGKAGAAAKSVVKSKPDAAPAKPAAPKKAAAPAKAAAPRTSSPARKASAPTKAAPRKSAPRKVASRKVDAVVDGMSRAKAIREWATANGHAVSERGRISASVVEAFDAAN